MKPKTDGILLTVVFHKILASHRGGTRHNLKYKHNISSRIKFQVQNTCWYLAAFVPCTLLVIGINLFYRLLAIQTIMSVQAIMIRAYSLDYMLVKVFPLISSAGDKTQEKAQKMPSLKRRPIDFSAFDVFLEFLPCRREPRNPPPPPRSSRNSSFQLNTTSCCIFSFLTLHFALYSFFLCMCSVHVHVAEFKTL